MSSESAPTTEYPDLDETPVTAPITLVEDQSSGQPQPTLETLDTTTVLATFENSIDPKTVSRIERTQEEVIIIHCTDLYECCRFGYQRNEHDLKKIESHRELLKLLSREDTLEAALVQLDKLPEEEKKWVTSRLNDGGSVVPQKFTDGTKKGVVMMNDIETRRKWNSDRIERTSEQKQLYDRDYERTMRHEIRHSEFYDRYGRDLEAWYDQLGSIRPLTPREQRKYHIDRLTKDEIAAHIENEVLEKVGTDGEITVKVNWKGIIRNLMKPDYRDPIIFPGKKDRMEYNHAVNVLVGKAKQKYQETHSIPKVMEEMVATNVDHMFSD